MSAENMKLLIEAFQGLGADAKEAFLVWVVADKVAPVLMLVVAVIGLLLAIRTIARAVAANNADTSTMADLGEMLGMGMCGVRECGLSSGQRREIVLRVQSLLSPDSTTVTVINNEPGCSRKRLHEQTGKKRS